jgi:RNA 2',3'-cyclic 3'-phosphodiesterase
MTEAGTVRTFIALDPPEAVLNEIAAIQNRMRKLLAGDIRWVNPAGIHLTLKFLGDITRTDVTTVADAVGPVAASCAPLSLDIGTAGFFPDAKRPRILWLGTGGDVKGLVALQAAVENALAGRGFPREERTFRPHLTLARIKSPRGLTGIAAFMDGQKDYRAGSFVGRAITFFQSTLTPKGAVYTKLAQFPFQENKP